MGRRVSILKGCRHRCSVSPPLAFSGFRGYRFNEGFSEAATKWRRVLRLLGACVGTRVPLRAARTQGVYGLRFFSEEEISVPLRGSGRDGVGV